LHILLVAFAYITGSIISIPQHGKETKFLGMLSTQDKTSAQSYCTGKETQPLNMSI